MRCSAAAGGCSRVARRQREALTGTGSAGTGREGTKRITVDLPRSEHKFLRDFAYDNDTDGMRVVRALLLELRDDPGLSPRVLDRMADLRGPL